MPPAARAELAALSIGPIAALAVVTSVFDPYAPNGNLRWGFYVLAVLYGIGSLFVLRARTMWQAAVRAPLFVGAFVVTGCAFVYWSEPASRLRGYRAYYLPGYLFSSTCAFVVGTALLLLVAFPVLRASNRRALDHGEGLVTAYGTLVILVLIPLSQYGNPLANRRYDAIVVSFVLPCVSLVLVLVQRARRFAFWRSATTIDAPAGVPLLFRAFDGDRCIVQSSATGNLGYREGNMRLPLARVPERIPGGAPLRLMLPLAPVLVAAMTFSVTLSASYSFGLPPAVADYAGGRAQVHPTWLISTPRGWKLWELWLGDDRYTLVGVDPRGTFREGKGLFTALVAAGIPDRELGHVALFTLLQRGYEYIPNRPPCARAKEQSFGFRDGDVLVICSVETEPTEKSPHGIRIRRYRVGLATGDRVEDGDAWLPNDGSIEDAAARAAGIDVRDAGD